MKETWERKKEKMNKTALFRKETWERKREKMNKKSLVKIGAIGIVVIAFLVIIFLVILPLFSSAILEKNVYELGEKVKINLNGDYKLKIVTPSTSYITKAKGEVIFEPKETGKYKIILEKEGKTESYEFEVVDDTINLINILNQSFNINETIEYNVPIEAKNGGEQLIQEKAEINKLVRWRKIENGKETAYETEAPKLEERQISKTRKQIKVYSPENISYEDVLAYTNIEEILTLSQKDLIKVYWKEQNTYLNFEAKDENGNGFIDRVEWIVPHLSEQNFEISIEILNVQSYPMLGGNWEVRFETIGKANLTIKAVNGTTWSNENEDKDLRFLEIKCGNKNIDYEWQNTAVFVKDFECNETAKETSKVLTEGKHTLEFSFGEEKEYAYNLVRNFTGVEAVDVSVAPINESAFIVAWVDRARAAVSFRIYDTQGNVIVNTVDVDTNDLLNDSRVDVEMINSTNFVVGWIDGGEDDITYSIYNLAGTLIIGPTDLDTAVSTTGNATDVSVSALGNHFVVCYVDFDEGPDADAYTRLNNGTAAAGEYNVDGSMGADLTLQNIHDCVGVNSTRWVSFYYDDGIPTPDTTFAIYSPTSTTEITAATDIDGNVGTNAQVAVTSLDKNKFVMIWYNSTAGSAIRMAIRTIDNAVILAPTVLDSNVGTDTRVAVAAINNNSATDSFVVVWWDHAAGNIQGKVYNGSGTLITPAFVIDSAPDDAYHILDVASKNPAIGSSLCNGTFVVTYTNSSNIAVFKTFKIDGTEWNGICDFTPPQVNITRPENKTYNIQIIPFNFSLNESGYCEYSLNNGLTNYTMTANSSLTGFNATNTSIADGSYTVRVYCNDTAGNKNYTSSVTFSKDTAIPTIAINSPANQTYTTTIINFNVSLNEAGSWCGFSLDGAANVSMTANSSLTGFNATNSTMAQGSHNVVFACNDTAGNINSSSGTRTFSIDSIVPAATINLPANITYNIQTIPFNFSLNEAGYCEYSLNNGLTNYTMTSNSSLTGFNATNTSIADGSYTATAYCNDSAGNRNYTSSVTFSKDTSAPQVTIVRPENITYNTQTIPFNFTLNEAGYCEYSLNNGLTNYTMTANSSFTGFNATNSSIAEGSYTVIAYCNDTTGNKNYTTTVTFSKDTTFPLISITYPQNISYNLNVSNLNYTLIENNPSKCWYSNSSGGWNSSAFAAGENFTNVTSIEGSNIWRVYCNDTAGNVNSSSVTFFKDTLVPQISIVAPENNSNFSTKNIDVNYTVSDANLQACWWTNNSGLSNNSITCGQNITGQSWNEGLNTIKIYVNDTTGNINSSSSVTFFKDSIFPIVNFTAPTADNGTTAIGINWIFVNVSVVEENEANITFSLFNSTQGAVNIMTLGAGNRTINWTNLDPGLYYYNVTVTDILNNQNSTETRTRTLPDLIAPDITFNSPSSEGYFFNTSSVYLEVTLSEQGSLVWYQINSSLTNYTMQTSDNIIWNATNNSIADGHYQITVFANDSFNNLASNSRNFSVDATSPLISFGERTENSGINVSRNWIYVNVSAVEENEANITFSLYNTTSLVNETTFTDKTRTINWTNLLDGIYYYNVSVIDYANNKNSTETRVINLDTSIPQVIIVRPENITYSTSSMPFNFSLNESGYCEYSLNNGVTNYTMTANSSFTGFNATNSSIADGSYTVRAYCSDTAGNKNYTTTVTFNKDATSPLVNITYPQNRSYNINVSNLNYTLIENNPNKCWYSNSSGAWNSTIATAGENFTNVISVEGSNIWRVYCNDTAGNENSSSITFFKDTLVPQINIVAPENNSNFSTKNVNVNYTVFDANLRACWWTNNSGLSNHSITCGENITGQSWNEGLNAIKIYVNDTTGNVNSSSVSFFVDSIFPLISFGSGTENNGAEFERDWIYVNVSVNETNFANITYELYNETGGRTLVNRTVYTELVLTINWTNLNSTNITYYYNASVADLVNHINSTETRSIKLIDITPPNLTLTSPETTIYDTNESLSLSYTAEDLHLQACWYNLNNGTNQSLENCQGTTFSCPEGSNTLYLFANDSLGLVSMQNVTFVANSSLIFTNEYRVERGSVSVNGQANVVINRTDKNKAFVNYKLRGASAPNAVFVSAKFLNSTMLQFQNYIGAVSVDWEVITGPDIVVQRGELPYSTSDSSFILGINNIDISNSFLIVNARVNSSATTDYTDGLWRGRFVGNNVINFTRLTNGAGGNLSWQVVSWAETIVQNGSSSFTTASMTPSFSTSVNTNNSFMFFSYACSGAQLRHYFVQGRLINNSNLFFKRETASGTVDADWFVVEWNRARVDRGTYGFGAVTSANVSLTKVLYNLSRSFSTSSATDIGGTGSTNNNALVTNTLTNNTNLLLQKGGTGQTNNVSWQVIELIELDAPIVNLIYPSNNQNFSSFAIPQFNYSVFDDSSLVNCSLYGNWSTGWHVNQTIQNPDNDVSIEQNFSSVNVGNDGYYKWNVECTDVYENIGRNSTNFTFAAFLFPDALNVSYFNISQTINDGKGNITLYWNLSTHSAKYKIYYSNNLTSFVYLNETSALNYTDTSFSGQRRRFYRVDSWNPTGQNSSASYFGVHVYTLQHNGNTRNWLGFPTNFLYLTNANKSLYEIRNLTAFTMWNETTQKRITCNLFNCPDTFECTDTNCNFNLQQGRGYEVNINSSAPSSVNWSGVGVVYNKTTLTLFKNDTSFHKNWIAMHSNTTLNNAQNLIGNISNADAVTKWNSQSQRSEGLIYSPFPGVLYLGTNFNITMEVAYEVSVNETMSWEQK